MPFLLYNLKIKDKKGWTVYLSFLTNIYTLLKAALYEFKFHLYFQAVSSNVGFACKLRVRKNGNGKNYSLSK